MIVLWGVPGDGPLDAVHRCLSRLGADVRVLDQRDAARSSVEVRAAPHGLLLSIEGPRTMAHLEFEQVGAAYLRPVETEQALPQDIAGDRLSRLHANAIDRAMIAWADVTTTMVINPPAAMAVNNSKPYQLRLIAEFGFDVPQTLVTTDPSAVRAFAAQHGRLIYKSVSGTRSIVNTLTDTSLERLECVENAPTQFQEYIPGCDVRVHVVGTEVFATEVRSEAHDYRYASLYDQDVELLPVTIPSEVAERCRSMTARMGLSVSGIDLRHTPDDSWVCFEVNPSPAFVYYEAATEQPIGEAIARLLIRADIDRQQLRAGVVAVDNIQRKPVCA